MAIENDKRRPIPLDPAPDGSIDLASESHVPVETGASSRTAPPRVLKPSRTTGVPVRLLSPSAKRMREYRRRRRRGMRCVTVQVSEADIEALVAKGYLAPSGRAEANAIQEAADMFISDALGDA